MYAARPSLSHTHLKSWERFYREVRSCMWNMYSSVVTGRWSELPSEATAKNGLKFDNRYCWVCRFVKGTIVEVRAYLDSALVARLFDENPIVKTSAQIPNRARENAAVIPLQGGRAQSSPVSAETGERSMLSTVFHALLQVVITILLGFVAASAHHDFDAKQRQS